jgi:hypothetical protein
MGVGTACDISKAPSRFELKFWKVLSLQILNEPRNHSHVYEGLDGRKFFETEQSSHSDRSKQNDQIILAVKKWNEFIEIIQLKT